MKITRSILFAGLFGLSCSLTAQAAQNISKEEIQHFKLTKVGSVSVSETGGLISSPMDLHKEISKRADEKGAKYYVIIAAREHGPNFDAIADLYN
ncbi:DUF1471 domain-containing protein [Rosenbergiella australiborealis]|uniref:DUF1471 domain-containing protein n=1 Tax=Rosenbergiella australiborealis TaxID=1544696 RepID=A0ABS5T503_9GAMM|nr:DUF1471 domain-containing protein [Rosenbergiella australiborealis]MBT0727212.1 DUF1471 domain-containing protein [Rosenbergiella australiborealis]